MSPRFSRQRPALTFKEGLERPFLLDELIERDHERRLHRFEREQDRLQAEADHCEVARSPSEVLGWERP